MAVHGAGPDYHHTTTDVTHDAATDVAHDVSEMPDAGQENARVPPDRKNIDQDGNSG
jgi:hypothetical protein